MTQKPPGIVPAGGTHLLIDLFDASHLDDIGYITPVCVRAAEATGATVLDTNFHHFGEGCGITGLVILAESHLSIHTWPENGIATIDIYVCGSCDASKALPIFEKAFKAKRKTVIQIPRGNEEIGQRIAQQFPVEVLSDQENAHKILKIFQHFRSQAGHALTSSHFFVVGRNFRWADQEITSGLINAQIKRWIVCEGKEYKLTDTGYGIMGGL